LVASSPSRSESTALAIDGKHYAFGRLF
jgi:hypothetical protein